MHASILMSDTASAQRSRDREQIRILAVFHFVLAAFSIIGLFFLGLQFAMMHFLTSSPGIWENAPQNAGPPPEFFFRVFSLMYLAIAAFIALPALGNFLSGFMLLRRQARTFSIVVAGINCLLFPLGTILGIFTIFVLMRESVREDYERTSLDGAF